METTTRARIYKILTFTNSSEDGKPEYYDLKIGLAQVITEFMRSQGRSQTDCALMLDTDQPKVSMLVNNKVQGFSMKRLCSYVEALGYEVELHIQTKNKGDSGDEEGTQICKKLSDIKDKADEIKTTLATMVAKEINKRDMKQIEAAMLLGVDQPKVSLLKNHNVCGFSIERLCGFIYNMGHKIELHVIAPDDRPFRKLIKSHLPGK